MKRPYIQPVPTSKGLVCDLPMTHFVSGAVIHDETGGGFDGTATNSPILMYPGMEFTAASSQYVDVGTGPSSVKTMSCWIKPDDIAGADFFLTLNATQALFLGAGVLTISNWAGGTTYVNGVAGSAVTAVWTHVAFTNSTAANASDMDVGRSLAVYYDGLVADVRLYDRVLSAEEIRGIHALQRHKYQR